MQTPRHNITCESNAWAGLRDVADRIVRDADMPADTPNNRRSSRISTLLSMIGRGELHVTRPPTADSTET
jgi:hypothetical protein